MNEIPESYGVTMRKQGAHLAHAILRQLNIYAAKDICVVCSAEDADFLVRGFIEELESCHLDARIRLICVWQEIFKHEGISVSNVLRTYEESFDANDCILIVVHSILDDCVARTLLTKSLSLANPKRIFIVSPTILEENQACLSRDFPMQVVEKCELIHFATSIQKRGDGKAKKNSVPDIVRERRSREFPSNA